MTARDTGANVVFCIADDGPGMTPEVLAQVGTPFFSTREEGTGLGVAQCRRLVERESCQFTLASRENVGTTVTITFMKIT